GIRDLIVTGVQTCALPIFDFVLQPQILPALQNDGDVSVLPEEIVEGAEAEFVLFLALRVGEEFVDLQLADLVRNRLTGDRSEERSEERRVGKEWRRQMSRC